MTREELLAAVQARQQGVADAEDAVREAQQEVAQNPGDLAAVARLRAAGRFLSQARVALARARADLVAFDATRLLPDDAPVVLLPVRLETRFVAEPGGNALLVRIYPDELHVESHQPELTAGEVAAGAAYAELIGQAGADTEAQRRAFEQLAGRVGVTRALHVAELARAGLPAASAQARPTHSSVLPDRWTVHGFRGGSRIVTATGAPIPGDLALAPAPGATIPPDGPPLDGASRWLVDLDAALAVGMAVRVPMPDAGGLDRLVVLGVRAGEDAGASAERLRGLLVGHRFGAGLDLLPPGTPTNNTGEQASGWTRRPDAAELFDADREARSGPDLDAALTALGLAPGALTGLVHAGSSSPGHARAMHRALWPATFGYVLETLGGAAVTDRVIEAARTLFVGSVRGLGPLPLLRVGAQPYGLLPVTSIGSWRPEPGSAVGDVVRLLRRLIPEWLAAAQRVPHVGRPGADPDQELLDILGREAVSGGYRLRPVRGGLLSSAVAPLIADLDPAGQRLADAAFQLAGGLGEAPPLARMAFDPRTVRIRRAPVLSGPLSETDPLPGPDGGGPNYLRHLATRSERTRPFTGPGATSLLRALAERSARLADLDAAVRFSAPASVAVAKAALEPEVVDAVPQRPSPTPSRLLARSVRDVIPAAPAGMTVAGFIADATPAQVAALGLPHVREALASATDVRRALNELSTVPSAALDRLTRTALDACSHRLDAWLTGVATERLSEIRQRHPAGAYLGGYGWVDALVPKPPPQPVTDLPPGETGPLVQDPTNAGFVAAPSLAQASTAALLLSGHLSHRGSGAAADAFAVDLSSDRARVASWLLDGVRQGQPLGALLGYRFERGLHDGSRPGLELDRFIRPIRALAPIVADPAGTPEAVEATAASGVVDGVELLRLWRVDGRAVNARLVQATPPTTDAERAAVVACLESLAGDADAVADLLLAETVHQVTAGNLARAAAMSDAVGSGLGPPPEPDVLRTPRPAHDYQHRLVTLAPLSTAPAPGWAGARPRRRAEPRLERWAAGVLPAPAGIRLAARVVDAAGGVTVQELTLADAGVCALDVVHGADLELLLAEALAEASGAARVQVLRRGDPDWPGAAWPDAAVPLEDALDQGGWMAESLGSARPLATADLDARGTPAEPDLAELAQRAQTTGTAFRVAAAALEAAAGAATPDAGRLRAALFGLAGFGVPGVAAALRDARAPDADPAAVLAGAAVAALAETTRAIRDLDAAEGPAEAIRAVFGVHFPVLPVCPPPLGWTDAVTACGTPAFLDEEPGMALAWVQRLALVRAPLERYLLATGGSGGRYAPVQLPPTPRWIGLRRNGNGDPPDHALSVLVHAAGNQAGGTSLAGLVVDEWTDRVPSPTGTAGVAFHLDEPGARAPQAVLLAVPPVIGRAWGMDDLLDVVTETADLARIRMVGPEEVPWLGRFLPALLLAVNTAGDSIGIDLLPLVQREEAVPP